MKRSRTLHARLLLPALAAAASLVLVTGVAAAGGNARLTNDCHPGACGAGYVSDYTLATGVPYTDATLDRVHDAPAVARTSRPSRSTRATRA